MPRHYFIFDTSALVFKYIRVQDTAGALIKARLDKLFAFRAQLPKKIDFQLPNICMAECSKTFAWACFEANLYGIRADESIAAYGALKDALLADVRKDRIINSYELKSRHLVNIESIFTDDYVRLPPPDRKRRGKHLSSHDALIAAISIEIAMDHAGGLENATLVTAETRLTTLCRRLGDRYPRVLNVRNEEIEPYLRAILGRA